MKLFKIMFLLILIFFTDCTDRKFTDEKLYIQPENIEAGQKLNIFYNSAHKDALYKNTDSLIVRYEFSCSGLNSRIIYKNKLNVSNTNIYTSEVLVPENTYFIRIYILPNDIEFSKEFLSGPVYKNNKYAKGTIPQMMLYQDSFDAVLALFNEDEALFPNFYLRYDSFWEEKLKKAMPLGEIQNQIDSIYNIVINTNILKSNDDKLVELLILLRYYTMFENFEKVNILLYQIHSILINENAQNIIFTIRNTIYKNLSNIYSIF